MRYYAVLLPISIDRPFTYSFNGQVKEGQLVKVPFRSGSKIGVVLEEEKEPTVDASKIKPLTHVFEDALTDNHMAFLKYVSDYYLQPHGLALKQMLSTFQGEGAPKERNKSKVLHKELVTLNTEQQVAFAKIQPTIDLCKHQGFVLHGITGSGKTEVYIAAVAEALKRGRQALILLPEIALTNQIIAKFEQRLGQRVYAWHANVSSGPKARIWERALAGEPMVVVGARSALFIPFTKLGFITVDEEHDHSYKQEEQFIYHARDMAVVKAKIENVPIVLATATPSLETLHNIESGRFQKLHLPSRYGEAELPTIHLVDMRLPQNKDARHKWLSVPLVKSLRENLAEGQQSILFLNRRGFAPITLCEACGYVAQCPQCDTHLVLHIHEHMLRCHHCGYLTPHKNTCPSCNVSNSWVHHGPGIEQLEQYLADLFPEARLLTLTSDSVTGQSKLNEALDKIHNHEVDIILGTQILAKGHHFPNVTLVGIIDGDSGFLSPQLRAAESTFHLLQQVSGRAGRGEKPGHVYVQTHNTDSSIMQAVQHFNVDEFLALEKNMRQTHMLPPFGAYVRIEIASKDEEGGKQFCQHMKKKYPLHDDIFVHGPSPSPMYKLKGFYHWQFTVHAPKHFSVQRYISTWLRAVGGTPKGMQLTVNIDPY